MALTETFAYKIEVNENRSIGVRRADIVLKDDVEIARSYHRKCFAPGSDVSAEPKEVQDVADAVWTDEVVAEYRASLPVDDQPSEAPEVAPMQTKKK